MQQLELAGDVENGVADDQQMETFLRSVERRGFLMARLALRNDDDALDVLQDSMLRLVQSYSQRPPEEWRPLFYRILGNRINDFRRRRQFRQRLFGWLGQYEADDRDPVSEAPDPRDSDPASVLSNEQSGEALAAAVAQLPPRQQQAFMLRCWEGLSTADTATAMGCSEGSVKTHYSRAVHFLRRQLEVFSP